jgi:hypothetical protein
MRQMFRTDGRHEFGIDRAGKRLKIIFEMKR